MPFSLAIFGSNRADGVIEDHPEVTDWVIAGHSLGGVMAARYTSNHPETIDGLALWASYPEDGVDLSSWNGETTSIFGTLDGLTKVTDIEDSRARLPSSTAFVAIEGGNHAYFGWYGAQRGDNPATITREDQQRIIIDATAAVVGALVESG
jgi:pimeloyl-ACP methyl ester carboxylesterase